MKASRFIECMESYRGIVEVPDGSNRTVIGRECGWDGVSWCCWTCSLALSGAKWNGHGFDYAGGFWDGSKLVIPGVGGGDYRHGWAAVPSIVAAFKRAGMAGTEPRYPCLMAFRWSADPMDSHIGAAIRPAVITDEGNHRNRCEQWSRDPHSQVWAYLYPPWEPESTQGDDDMTDLEHQWLAETHAAVGDMREKYDRLLVQVGETDAAVNRLEDAVKAIRSKLGA